MSTTSMLKAKGLSTFPNPLSISPEGSQLKAANTIIDRDGIIEPRRGIKILGESYDIPKQLLTFKENILVHSNDVLQYSNGLDPATFTSFKGKSDFSPTSVDTALDTITINLHGLSEGDAVVFSTTGTLPAPLVAATTYFVRNPTQNTFQLAVTMTGTVINLTSTGTLLSTINYDYVFDEVQAGLRIKYIEMNGNLLVTTANGIKKITQNSEYSVTNAGVVAALDATLQLDISTTLGFLPAGKEVAYRIVWGTKDINDNLLLGTASYRAVVVNNTESSRNVIVTFTVPDSITTDYFYQVYRTNFGDIGGSGDEMNLVYESPYTGGTSVTVVDQQPEDLRDSGTPLYSNQFSGEGAFQTNDQPPIAKDISTYKNTAFYANTTGTHQTTVTLLGLDAFFGIEILSVTGANPATVTTSTAHGLTAGNKVDIKGAGTISGIYTISNVTPTTFEITADSVDYNPTATDAPKVFGGYITTEKNGAINEYFIVGQPEIYDVVYKTKTALVDSAYFLINSADAAIKYCFYYNKSGSAVAPTLAPAEGEDRAFIEIDISTLGTQDFNTSSVNIATDTITLLNHGFVLDDPITFSTTGTLPSPLDSVTTYYVANPTTDTFQVSLTIAGPAIDITTQGSGTHSVKNDATVTSDQVAEASSAVIQATGDFLAGDITTTTITTITSGTGLFAGYPTGQNGTIPGLTSIALNTTGYGENIANLEVRLSTLLSPAAAIEETAKSLVKVINNNPNEGVYAYYTPTSSDLPGTIQFKSKTQANIPFNVTSTYPGSVSMFNPDIRTTTVSISEASPNKVFFSKTLQPEAVPITNSITVGPKDKAILRILGLRDSLFILKEEGTYRLTGDNFTNFSVTLFDNSANIIAADTAAVLNNQIFCLSTQGIVTIDETGVGVVSRSVESTFTKITAPAFLNYKTQSFGYSYESDRSYTVFIPTDPIDDTATLGMRYNTFTQAWTEWPRTQTCGVIEDSKNLMYLGAADTNAVEIERKTLTSRDYVDREFNRAIVGFDNDFIYVDNVVDIEVGDALTQTQYVTFAQYNSLVRKLALDPQLTISLTEAVPGDSLTDKMDELVASLNIADTHVFTGTFDPSTVAANEITLVGNTFVVGDVVRFSGAQLPTGITANTPYYVTAVNGSAFKVGVSPNTSLSISAGPAGTTTVSSSYIADASTFADTQVQYNFIIYQLNHSPNAFFADYPSSIGTVYEDLIVDLVNIYQNRVKVRDIAPFFVGPVIHYKSIKSDIIWNHMTFGDPSLSKHVREGVVLVENNALTRAILGFATDLSGDFEFITFNLDGSGNWGASVWGNVAWGGSGVQIPLRTIIPRQKQRCRYIRARFQHRDAFGHYAIYGIAYTFEINSERAWRY